MILRITIANTDTTTLKCPLVSYLMVFDARRLGMTNHVHAFMALTTGFMVGNGWLVSQRSRVCEVNARSQESL